MFFELHWMSPGFHLERFVQAFIGATCTYRRCLLRLCLVSAKFVKSNAKFHPIRRRCGVLKDTPSRSYKLALLNSRSLVQDHQSLNALVEEADGPVQGPVQEGRRDAR